MVVDRINSERVIISHDILYRAIILQPLDLTANNEMINMTSQAFSDYLTGCITRELLIHPGKDITTIVLI